VSLRAQGLPLPAGAALLCPWVDLTCESILTVAGETRDADPFHRYSDAYLPGHPIDDPVVNPLAADLSGLPPLLIQTATGDHSLPESRLLAERASGQGVDARLELYPADTHVFHVFWSFLPEAADALQQAGAFIREMLRAGVSTDRAAS
jgi:acetyl esterase/lipase